MKIVHAEYAGDYKVKLFFSDKKQRTVDFGEFILSNSDYPVFYQYKDLKKFKKFKIDRGNIIWGRDWDLIFPLEELYQGTIKFSKKNYDHVDSGLSLVAEPRVKYGKK